MSEDIVKVDGPKTCPCFGRVSMEEGFLGKAITQAVRVVSKEQIWMDGTGRWIEQDLFVPFPLKAPILTHPDSQFWFFARA